MLIPIACDEPDIDLYGNDVNSDPNDKDYGYDSGRRDSASQCQSLCQSRKDCNFFTFKKGSKECWLKTSDFGRKFESGSISGPKFCGNECNIIYA